MSVRFTMGDLEVVVSGPVDAQNAITDSVRRLMLDRISRATHAPDTPRPRSGRPLGVVPIVTASPVLARLARIRQDLELVTAAVVPPLVLDDRQPTSSAQLVDPCPDSTRDPGRLAFGDPVRPAGFPPLEGEPFDVAAVQAAVLVPDRLGEDPVGDHLGVGQRLGAQDLAGLDAGQPRIGWALSGAFVHPGLVVPGGSRRHSAGLDV